MAEHIQDDANVNLYLFRYKRDDFGAAAEI